MKTISSFPQTIYIASIYYVDKEEDLPHLVTYYNVSFTLEETVTFINSAINNIGKENYKDAQGAYIYKLRISERIESSIRTGGRKFLNKKMEIARAKAFNIMAFNSKLYKVLVVPRDYDKVTKTFRLAAAFPILVSDDMNKVVKKIEWLKLPISPKAQEVALYIIEKKSILNLENMTIRPINLEAELRRSERILVKN
jgi:hypothetical protein